MAVSVTSGDGPSHRPESRHRLSADSDRRRTAENNNNKKKKKKGKINRVSPSLSRSSENQFEADVIGIGDGHDGDLLFLYKRIIDIDR